MLYNLILLLPLARNVLAQSTTPTSSSSWSNAGISPGASISTTSISSYTVESLFLPIDNPGNLFASVVTASPNQTAYAIGCSGPSASCAFNQPATITEGPSTLIYTMTTIDEEDSSTSQGTTINCTLTGQPCASIAVCIGRSAISGLGDAVFTLTLGSSQIHCVPVTITAGATKLMAIPDRMGAGSEGSGSSSSSGGARPAATGDFGVRWTVNGAAIGVALIGLL